MPSIEVVKQYLAAVVIPVLSGAAANWAIIHLHFLAAFHVTAGSVAGVLSQLGVFGITAALGWLSAHHILSGHWLPAAKKAAARPVFTELASTGISPPPKATTTAKGAASPAPKPAAGK